MDDFTEIFNFIDKDCASIYIDAIRENLTFSVMNFQFMKEFRGLVPRKLKNSGKPQR